MIEDKRVEEFETKYRDEIFEAMYKIRSKEKEIIDLMIENSKKLGLSEFDIPRISITVNNKIVELSQEFKSAGISMFSSKQEEYDMVNSSFIGDAIIDDLFEKLNQANTKLGDYGYTMKNIAKKKEVQVQALTNITPTQRVFAKIKSFFKPVKPIDLSLTSVEKGVLRMHEDEYRNIDNMVWKYNLKDNLVSSLVKFIHDRKYSSNDVPVLLDEEVIPDLKKLGLESLIPELQQAIVDDYKRNIPFDKYYKISLKDFVPNFGNSPAQPETHENSSQTNQKSTQPALDEER